MWPFPRNTISIIPANPALHSIPTKSMVKNSAGRIIVPSAIRIHPSPIPTDPSVRILIPTNPSPVPAHSRKSSASLSVNIVQIIPPPANTTVISREICFLRISIQEFTPRNASIHASFIQFTSISLSPDSYPLYFLSALIFICFIHICCMHSFRKLWKILPVLLNASTHCRTPDYDICFPVP